MNFTFAVKTCFSDVNKTICMIVQDSSRNTAAVLGKKYILNYTHCAVLATMILYCAFKRIYLL